MNQKTTSSSERAHDETGGRIAPSLLVRPEFDREVVSLLGNQVTGRLLRGSFGIVQPQLRIGPSGDSYEREADRVAQEIISASAPTVGQHKSSGAGWRKQEESVQRRAEGAGPAVAPPAVHEVLGLSGQPLAAAARAFLEPRFGRSFGDVRVHADEQAAAAARSVDALAFTVGRDVVFGEGQYAPETPAGRQLLAHELTHVLQQSGTAGTELLRRLPEPKVPIQQRQGADEQAVSHPVVEGVGNVSVSVGSTMTAEAGLRAIYDQAARQITQEALKMAAAGNNTPEAIEKAARWAVQARNELKAALRAKGSVVTKALAEARNIKKYGDKIGPSYDQLIREGKTPPDIIGSAGKANTKLSKAATKLKVAGRLLIAIDVAIVTWEVISAPEGSRLRAAVGGLSGLAGALAGGEAGAIGGAKLGGLIGTFIEPGGGTAIGAGVGGIIGGIGGAIAGGFFGKKAGEGLFDIAEEVFAPNIDADMNKIDAGQDAIIRGQAK